MFDRINRRHLLAGAAAVPLLPAAAVSGQLVGKPPEPDPAVAAYERWLDAYAARLEHTQAQVEAGIDLDDDDPVWLRLTAAEDAAIEALVRAVPTTPGGGAGKLHLLLVLAGYADDFDCVWSDPETFTAWNWTDERDRRCALSLLAGLRQMGGQT